MSTRLTPSESFPEDLASLALPEVEILNSKVQRELIHEYAHDGESDPETEFRNEELTEELDRRDVTDASDASDGAGRTSDASGPTARIA